MTQTIIRSDRKRIPLSEPLLAGNEKLYIDECIDTNFVSSVGAFVVRFEQAVAEFAQTRHGVAVVNGTAALHTALIVAGVQADDEVLVSDLTFVAPANAVRYVGAWPVFIDAEPRYFQMDAGLAVDFLERNCVWRAGELKNRHTGRRVRAILPVHILGHPVDLEPILEMARKYDLAVIEDATESLGSKYRGSMVGSLGQQGVFSFNGNKIITTGGGGMIVTNDESAAKRAKYLTTQAKDDPIEYVHNEIGYNYRLTNILAALGVAQMEHLPRFIERKREIARTYAEALADTPGVRIMGEADWAFSNFWLYTVLVDEARFGRDSRSLMRELGNNRIESRPLWCPMHMLPIYSKAQVIGGSVAESLYRDALSLPCSVSVSDEDIGTVVESLRQ